MKKNLIFILSFVLLALGACSDDDNNSSSQVAVAFSVPSLNLVDNVTPVQILFSSPATAAGSVTVTYATTGVAYATDFTTLPAATTNSITVPFQANATSVSFTFNKLVNAIEGEVKNVVFTIAEITLPNTTITGNTTIQVNFNETASLGSSLVAAVGGPMQPNQVYVDLSSGARATVPRVSWDLGFYTGSDFRVVLNSSLKMSAKALETTNIDEVQVADESMIISQGSGVASQIDNPTGDLTQTGSVSPTAIAAISAIPADNKVYLVNMGSNPGTTPPAVGSDASASGTSRGWKKIRVTRSGENYVIDYADIASTTHQTATITKNAAFNFIFFSTANGVVNVEPQKEQWDLNFTTFTNLFNPTTPYYYPDFVVTNTKGGATSYQVLNSEGFTYESFTRANVNETKFSTADQRNIGANWRGTNVVGPDGNPMSQFSVQINRFYVIKDPAGNIYKLKFTSALSPNGERGFPVFQYALLR